MFLEDTKGEGLRPYVIPQDTEVGYLLVMLENKLKHTFCSSLNSIKACHIVVVLFKLAG